jgi:hypothetical protein
MFRAKYILPKGFWKIGGLSSIRVLYLLAQNFFEKYTEKSKTFGALSVTQSTNQVKRLSTGPNASVLILDKLLTSTKVYF